ncbi:MAG: hypothetical protein V4573_05975 [Pseudomonadota bacterium]|nr:hypothetical protein [Polaromonas sp.]
MSQSLADFYSIPEQLFESTGALDPILGVDTRLFIDPALLRVSTVPELAESYSRIVSHFEDVLRIVANIANEGDRLWRQADRLLTFPEVPGLSIGYSTRGTHGSGMGPGLRKHLLATVREIVQAGVKDPALFELVGIFEDDIGPDRISDMVATIIAADLVRFTQRVCSDCGIPMQPHRLRNISSEEDLPTNPLNNEPLILVPKEVLCDLPVALDFADVRWIAQHNNVLREELNALVGSAWHKVTVSEQKAKLREDFLRFPHVLNDIIRAYMSEVPEQYDFANDPAGEVLWYKTSRQLPSTVPLELSLSSSPTLEEVEAVVLKICEHFKSLIEDNQLAKILYDTGGKPKHESASQLLFYGIASAYCRANNLDLSPESDAGRGPVDFKLSRGFEGKVLVEIKLTSNKQLAHGFETQLPIYENAEGSHRGIYLVIDNGGVSDARRNSFFSKVVAAGKNAPKVIWVDGSIRASASKADA